MKITHHPISIDAAGSSSYSVQAHSQITVMGYICMCTHVYICNLIVLYYTYIHIYIYMYVYKEVYYEKAVKCLTACLMLLLVQTLAE